MKSPLLLCMLMLACLSACSLAPGKSTQKSRIEELNKLDGPEVDSVTDTLEKSAIEAINRGDYKRAVSLYKQLHDTAKVKDSVRMQYAVSLASALRRAGGYDDSLKVLDVVLKNEPDNIDALEGKGLSLLGQGKSQDAGRVFEQVLKKDPKRWRTLNALGILFTIKNLMPEANAYYTEALKYSPDNPSILNNVGLSFAIERRYPKAIEALQQAARLSDAGTATKRQVELNIALVVALAGDLDQAKMIAARHLKGAALDNNLGLYAHLANNDELAKAYLNTALSGTPTYYERAWRNLEVITEDANGKNTPESGKSVRIQ